ncbi:MAG: hypothetical protein JRJ85_04455 [Deltaproteobacteria bacterium]|nr:hypothetical protein [Deltaproteobacteria bacterium]
MASENSITPFEKRIKRHVTGRTQTFVVITSPGLEKAVFKEIQSLPSPPEKIEAGKGWVEFAGRLQSCYLTNLKLRTAHRVLLRLTAFKSTNFRYLEKRLLSFPWELFLPCHPDVQVRVSTKGSRLYHTGAISDHVIKGVMKRLEADTHPSAGSSPSQPVRIFVRAVNDVFTLSLDSSGELLYKRGIKTHHAHAPLRETIASGALIMAGYDGTGPLIDPMCGAGTFALEAAMISAGMPPGWYRSFAFMDWPAFRPRQWAYLRRQEEKHIRSEPDGPLIFASDIEAQACAMLAESLETAGLAPRVRVERADFFDLSPRSISDTRGTVALNPPYGRRLGFPKESDALFHDICRKLQSDYKGWRLALIAPAKHLIENIPFRMKVHRIYHGGLNVYLLTGVI